MSNLPQIFQRMPLLLKRIALGIGTPVEYHPFRAHLNGLPFARRKKNRPFNQQATAGGDVGQTDPIALMVVFGDDL